MKILVTGRSARHGQQSRTKRHKQEGSKLRKVVEVKRRKHWGKNPHIELEAPSDSLLGF